MGKSGTVTAQHSSTVTVKHTPPSMATHKWEDNQESRSDYLPSNPKVRSPSLTLGSHSKYTAPERLSPQTSGIEVQWGLHAAEPKERRNSNL